MPLEARELRPGELVLLDEGLEDLRRGDLLLRGQKDRCRTLQVRQQDVVVSVGHRPMQKGVLHHRDVNTCLAHLATEEADLLHRETGEVGQVDPLRCRESSPSASVRDQPFSCRFIVPSYFGVAIAAAGSSRIPTPIVDETVRLLTYCPFAAGGFKRTTSARKVRMFSSIFSGVKEAFPTATCRFPALSTRNSILPAFASRTAFSRSNVTVPVFALGIEPARTEDPAELADLAHHVGGRDDLIEVEPTLLDLRDHVVGAHEVGPGALRLLDLLALREDEDADRLARPVRKDDRAADHLVGVLGIHAETRRDLDRLVELRGGVGLHEHDGLGQAPRS